MTGREVSQGGADSTALAEDCRVAMKSLRRALSAVYDAARADKGKPQDVSRRFGINRNTSAKLSRLMSSTNPFTAFMDLPGRDGFRLALEAFSKTEEAKHAAAGVEQSLDALDQVIATHADTRDEFELMLESMGLLDVGTARATRSREMAFQGNSGLWGVSARTRHSMVFLRPSDGMPPRVDYVHASQILGFRRLRPDVRWRLLRMVLANDKGTQLPAAAFPESIDLSPDPTLPLLVRPFCSANMPALQTTTSADGCDYLLPEGPVGKQAEFDVTVGNIVRGLPAVRTPTDLYGSVSASVTLPVETLLFDLVLHRDLRRTIRPEVFVFGFPHGGADGPAAQKIENLLWKGEKFVELDGPPPEVATPLVPRAEELAQYVFSRMGWKAEEFFCLRLMMAHPPMSSRVVLRWELAEGE